MEYFHNAKFIREIMIFVFLQVFSVGDLAKLCSIKSDLNTGKSVEQAN